MVIAIGLVYTELHEVYYNAHQNGYLVMLGWPDRVPRLVRDSFGS